MHQHGHVGLLLTQPVGVSINTAEFELTNVIDFISTNFNGHKSPWKVVLESLLYLNTLMAQVDGL